MDGSGEMNECGGNEANVLFKVQRLLLRRERRKGSGFHVGCWTRAFRDGEGAVVQWDRLRASSAVL